MRLGLVGRGKQAQRYLDPRNGGNMVVSQVHGHVKPDDYLEWLETVDGVIIATHPAAHFDLARMAISAGKPLLVEKPLALSWQDASDLIDEAEIANVPLEVAHTHLWHEAFPKLEGITHAACHLSYANHERDYSAWIDWGPHILSMLEQTGAEVTSWSLEHGERRSLRLDASVGVVTVGYTGREAYERTPMWHMLDEFSRGGTHGYDFQRRVYRALFEQEALNGQKSSGQAGGNDSDGDDDDEH